MDKQLWIKIPGGLDKTLKRSILARCGELCDGVMVDPGDVHAAVEAGVAGILVEGSGGIQLLKPSRAGSRITGEPSEAETLGAVKVTVRGRGDELKALEYARTGVPMILVECPDWKVIPLENLIAEAHGGDSKLIAVAGSLREAETALETLELGVDGVLLEASSPGDVESAAETLRPGRMRVSLVEGVVGRVEALGRGARVCVDTCDLLAPGMGCLVGSRSSGLFLVEAEVHENPHVEPRPFRVNAGPVSSYILAPGGRTQYLSELKAGGRILIVDREGCAKSSIIGRVKIEVRPLLLIEAVEGDETYKVILQNAETIRLVTPDGSKSVSELKPGDKVLLHREEGGRHFGAYVPGETIIER